MQKGAVDNEASITVAVCNTIGIKEVLVTCDKVNVASSKVIQNCGGELEEEFYSDIYKEVVQRYVILGKNDIDK